MTKTTVTAVVEVGSDHGRKPGTSGFMSWTPVKNHELKLLLKVKSNVSLQTNKQNPASGIINMINSFLMQ